MKSSRKRLLIVVLAALVVVVSGLAVALGLYLNSPAFEEYARDFIVRQIEARTGARASLEDFQWSTRGQRFVLRNVTIRGLEPEDGPPLARVEEIAVGLHLRSLLRRQIDLFELTVTRPEFHLFVAPDGRTNLPDPPARASRVSEYRVAIENFSIGGGAAFINERRIQMDFAIRNLDAALRYRSDTGVLSATTAYDGVFERSGRPAIPYSLSADVDYTRGTLAAHRIDLTSGPSTVGLQGRIDGVLTEDIAGRLEYTGSVDIPFLNYFFLRETFSGAAAVAGRLEFSRNGFAAEGTAASASLTFEDWNATDFRGEYAYRYPEKQLRVSGIDAGIVGGAVSGSLAVTDLPGPSRVTLDLSYRNIDAARLARIYPWDPRYRIYSRVAGRLEGWFEGKFERFALNGAAQLSPYAPPPMDGVVALPLEGAAVYEAQPGRVRLTDADAVFHATTVQAEGLIDVQESNLNLRIASSDLTNAAFLYGNANGGGSFEGTLSGPIRAPVFEGQALLREHRHGDWLLQEAAGRVRLDAGSGDVELTAMRVRQGESEAVLDGGLRLGESALELRIAADAVRAQDVAAFIDMELEGTISAEALLTSLRPLHIEGAVRAQDLVVEGQPVGAARAEVTYAEPALAVRNLTVSRNGASLTGDFAYDADAEAIDFNFDVRSLPLEQFRILGLPDSLQGIVDEARFSGSGTRTRPEVRGEAGITDLAFFNEVIPRSRLTVASSGPEIHATLSAGNLQIEADIDTSRSDYPFTGYALFTDYSVEKLAGFEQGVLTVSGDANLNGSLKDLGALSGYGNIQSLDTRIQDRPFQSRRQFDFSFNSERLNLSGLSLQGEGTSVDVSGAIGLRQPAPIDLEMRGNVDLALLQAIDPELIVTGSMAIDGTAGGTVQNPDISGSAEFVNASLGRRGLFTSLTGLEGQVHFDGSRVSLNDLTGQVGGGTVQIAGTGLVRNGQLDEMDVRIDSSNVRIRYPEGLRTVIDGTMVLRGNLAEPLLEGNLQIRNMSYGSEFEDFLSLFQNQGFEDGASPWNRLRLSLRVEGSRGITIQNRLADVEARVELDVKGTAANPAVTGHVEASGGSLFFQGTRYEVTRGNIDFIDPVRIEPLVDIQAEANLRTYRVILAISGRARNLRLDLRSDPPLPQLEIVSLIAGGRTREELRDELRAERETSAEANSTAPTSEQLFQGGAASILFDLLRTRVGGNFGLLGLDRVRIDPLLPGTGNANPSARITLSERVTSDLSITYSQDLAANQQQLILIEYWLSRDVSILASRNENGELGMDLRLRRRF